MTKSALTDRDRLSLMTSYVTELGDICRKQFNGDWDKMPSRDKLDINWTKVIRMSRISGMTKDSAAKVIGHAKDELIEQAFEQIQ